MQVKTTLYKKHKTSMGWWSIQHLQPNILKIEYASTMNGKVQEQIERVAEGKQGRSLDDQCQHRMQSRISKQLDKGYKRTIEEAEKMSGTDVSGNLKPMLAQSMKQVSSFSDDSYVQLKLDGHRMLVTNDGGTIRAYSRQGKPIETVPHILDNISIPEGMVIDGELYHHGTPLQTIASWAKRRQDNTSQLEYVVYDMVMDAPFSERLALLQSDDVVLGDAAHVLKSKHLSTFKTDLNTVLRFAKSRGYEGLILRQNTLGYEVGRRSKSLVKIKQAQDAEYTVVDIVPSREGWGILVCQGPKVNQTFKVSAPGTIANKQYVMNNKDVFIGKLVKVEFSELTKDGIPFHPVALEFYSSI